MQRRRFQADLPGPDPVLDMYRGGPPSKEVNLPYDNGTEKLMQRIPLSNNFVLIKYNSFNIHKTGLVPVGHSTK